MADVDFCANFSSNCTFPGRFATNVVRPISWSDGGAGGQFGKLVNDVFTPCAADEVTHYKCPATPMTIAITVTTDDTPQAINPFNPLEQCATFDDAAVSNDPPARATVYDIVMEGPDSTWRPKGGTDKNTATITMEVTPAVDHRGISMAGNWTVSLSLTSDVEGHCMNFGTEGRAKDILIKPQQAGWNDFAGSGYQSSQSSASSLTASIQVESLDYGGWTRLQVDYRGAQNNLTSRPARDKSKPDIGPDRRTHLNLPVDEDGDHIADGHDRSLTKNGFGGPVADCDPEVIYPGNSNLGDGFSDYEEYRGFKVGGGWRELDRNKAEVFVEHPDDTNEGANSVPLDLSGFRETGLDVIRVSAADCSADGVMNPNKPEFGHPFEQKRIKVVMDDVYPGVAQYFGYAWNGPGIPAQIEKVALYRHTISDWVTRTFPNQVTAAKIKMYRVAVAHELGHSVNLQHHVNSSCYMIEDPSQYDVTFLNVNRFHQYCGLSVTPHLTGQMKLR